jgi:hypothetical protein
MHGYINNNNIDCKTPIYIKLLHTTGDICNDSYSLFIDSTNILEGNLQQNQYTFSLLISNKFSINQTIVPVFDKSYYITVKLFDSKDYKHTFVLNTDDKIIIGDNLYKLTYTFSNTNYNSTYLMCNIYGFINDSFNLSNSNSNNCYDEYIIIITLTN